MCFNLFNIFIIFNQTHPFLIVHKYEYFIKKSVLKKIEFIFLAADSLKMNMRFQLLK